jgi:hypothetical protein
MEQTVFPFSQLEQSPEIFAMHHMQADEGPEICRLKQKGGCVLTFICRQCTQATTLAFLLRMVERGLTLRT